MSIWKISKKTLLNLENEGFDTDTWSDRMEILKEVSCFQIYIISNEVKAYEKDKKIMFITDIAKKLNETVNINQVDLNIPTYTEENLPSSLSALKAVKPGSRKL